MRAKYEGGFGLSFASSFYGVSAGTMSNYICPVSWALYRLLKANKSAFVTWPDTVQGKQMEGLCYTFPEAVCFIDGAKFQAWRPEHGDIHI